METINSHIQLSKIMMKLFSHQRVYQNTNNQGKIFTNCKNVTWCLDFQNDSITEVDIELTGSEKGYYSEEKEKFLSEKFESVFSDLAHSINSY